MFALLFIKFAFFIVLFSRWVNTRTKLKKAKTKNCIRFVDDSYCTFVNQIMSKTEITRYISKQFMCIL